MMFFCLADCCWLSSKRLEIVYILKLSLLNVLFASLVVTKDLCPCGVMLKTVLMKDSALRIKGGVL